MLEIKIRTQLNSLCALHADCFTQANYGAHVGGADANDTLSVATPLGVLGGSVAAMSAGDEYIVRPGTTALEPVGLFVNDATGAAFENSPAVASNKVAVIKGMASVEVSVYETRNAADNADLTYAVGEELRASAQGLLTNEGSGRVIGIVTKIPTVALPNLGLDMRI